MDRVAPDGAAEAGRAALLWQGQHLNRVDLGPRPQTPRRRRGVVVENVAAETDRVLHGDRDVVEIERAGAVGDVPHLRVIHVAGLAVALPVRELVGDRKRPPGAAAAEHLSPHLKGAGRARGGSRRLDPDLQLQIKLLSDVCPARAARHADRKQRLGIALAHRQKRRARAQRHAVDEDLDRRDLQRAGPARRQLVGVDARAPVLPHAADDRDLAALAGRPQGLDVAIGQGRKGERLALAEVRDHHANGERLTHEHLRRLDEQLDRGVGGARRPHGDAGEQGGLNEADPHQRSQGASSSSSHPHTGC